jgi:hypothetical protein
MNEDSKLDPGRKVGLQLSYTSTNTLTLSKGFFHINNGTNDYLVEVPATTITDATTGWPGAGAGVYITGKPDGTITLRASTCTVATRPSDNLFKLTGGSVGYNDLGLFAYMYDADERVLAHFWEVSSTSFYIINLGSRREEIGENSNGKYARTELGAQTCRSNITATTDGAAYIDTTWTYPVPFVSVPSVPTPLLDNETASGCQYAQVLSAYSSVSAITVQCTDTTSDVAYQLLCSAIGEWY